MKKNNFLSFLFLFFVAFGFAQTDSERREITNKSNLTTLAQLELQYAIQFAAEKAEALALASINGWEEFIEIENGGQAELVGVFSSGEPIYYATENPEGAITTRTDKVHTGGGAGLDLNGEGMVAGVWDGGRVRETHELIGGRATQVDGTTTISSHSTHVAGTMIGTGTVNSGNAKGMAPLATLEAYSFNNDEAEMAAAAATGLLVSNHSYGIPADGVPLWYLGYYDTNARDMDNIAYNAPFYLPVCSAGNDRQSGANTSDGGYDYLTDKSVAKNTIICAATNEVLNYTGPSSVVMSSFSSWGPTDDGRVKPDISAKGVNMLSSVGTSNTAYSNFSGTSMATPNTSGSLILLQQHYNDINGNFMLSSTLRGLALHTVDEAGSNPGPDYRFGWGLLNTERAAEVISNNGKTSEMREIVLAQGQTYTLEVNSDNINDFVASITWTDPAGTVPPQGVEDAFIPSLVNDLDLRVTEVGGAGTVHMPWKLNPANFTAAATTGDNIVDNIEKIEVGGASGKYLIEVTHKGTLTNAAQTFSLIVTGIVNDFSFSTTENDQEICNDVATGSYAVDVDFIDTFTETVTFTVSDVPTGAVGIVSPATLNDDGQITLNLTGLNNVTPGEYFMEITGNSISATNSITLALTIIESDLATVVLTTPADTAVEINTDLTFIWEELTSDAVEYDFELATDAAFADIVVSETTFVPTVTVTDLDEDTEYFWRVRGTNICDEGDFSDVFSFTTTETLGINENAIEGLVVYPNPTSNVLNITAAKQMSSIEIVNVLGQTLLSKKVGATQIQIDLSTLAAGNYFVRVQAENATTVLQIVKK
ncbi:S8 family serine peptidase [Rasiella sp. SM2506]|uniref:S8 family serine peptidase n=1 Tax=Rasiella sp. SM2506 TaxID=3423914 RepID=UPI003D7BCA35